MKVAIVHDWLTVYGGAEKVLEQIFQIYPNADLFSVIDFLPEEIRCKFAKKKTTTSFIQRLPFARTLYRYYLPWMPLAIQQLDVTGYDLVISSSSCVAKGVLTGPHQLHICYCHSPMRYIWDLQFQYLKESGFAGGIKGKLLGIYIRKQLSQLRLWDYQTAQTVDAYISNSHFVKKRIQKYYRRESAVLYPPVDTEFYKFQNEKHDFYLTASRLVPYKKIDLIVEAFAQMPDKKLVVIGSGPDEKKIRKLLRPNIRYLGYQPPDVLREYLQNARAFVFVSVEDFGIAPLEAQSCGTAVIGLAKGGLLETVHGLDMPNPTGCFFLEQTASALMDAITQFEENSFRITPLACRNNALRFSIERFKEEFKQFVDCEPRP